MAIAIKDGSLIVKDGKVAESCRCCGGCTTQLFCNKTRNFFVSCVPRSNEITAILSPLYNETFTFDWEFSFSSFSATLSECENWKFSPSENTCTLFRETGGSGLKHTCAGWENFYRQTGSTVNDYVPFVALEVFPKMINTYYPSPTDYTLELRVAKWFENGARAYGKLPKTSRLCEYPCPFDFFAFWKWSANFNVPMCTLMESLGVLNLTLQNTNYTRPGGNDIMTRYYYGNFITVDPAVSGDTSLDVEFIALP